MCTIYITKIERFGHYSCNNWALFWRKISHNMIVYSRRRFTTKTTLDKVYIVNNIIYLERSLIRKVLIMNTKKWLRIVITLAVISQLLISYIAPIRVIAAEGATIGQELNVDKP